jgi:DNA-binding MarR family transcriptional regulator
MLPQTHRLDLGQLIRYAYNMSDEKNQRATSIVRGVLSLGRRLRAERPAGSAGLSAIAILATLHRLGPIPAIRLAAEERLQPQSLTRILAGLERQGWIARTAGTTDRRERLIAVTPQGLGALASDLRAREGWLEAAMAATLSGEERETLLRAAALMGRLAACQLSPPSPPTP